MSFEQDPRRGRRPGPVVRRRRRGALAPTLVILGVIVVVTLVLAQVWTDVLWYRQLGYLEVYRNQMLTKAFLFLAGGAVMAAGVFVALLLAYRSRPVYAPVASDQGNLDRYRETIEPLRRLVVIAVPIGLGLFAASAASQEWQTFLLWWNGVSFGTTDAQFHLDVGFFVFTLPWLQFITSFLTAVVFLAGLASVVTHYLYGGLRLQGGAPRLTSAARIQLSSLAAAFILLRAIDYWLGRYGLATKQGKLITGLTYTDARASLTAKGVLAGIALIVAVLFVVSALVERWRLLPLYGVVLLVVSAILVGGIYPAVVQRFRVTPSAASLEAPYIQRNINATKTAFGLDDVQITPYQARTQASPDVLLKDTTTVPGIRLIDPSLVSPTFRQLEQNKQYYSFPQSLDVDRYPIDGRTEDTVIAVRELNLNDAPTSQRNWYSDHVVYTHGYGVVAAYGTRRTTDGQPVFFQSGIPSVGKLGNYEARVYFGEESPEYSIVGAPSGATPRELDYPDNTTNGQQLTTYTGKGGVPLGSAFNQLLYAIKFREQNILLSNAVNSDSRIMYDREPRLRVEKVAPFLTLDGDPYPAVVDGRVVWIVDGYTTSSQYPYSALENLDQVTSNSLTANASNVVALQAQQINYMRNSVKATVDAYDGSVTLYAWDDQDPVLKTWMKAFPNVVKPLSDMSSQLMQHVRYPEDLFQVQRDLLGRYHVEDPNAFFNQQDYWQVPDDPADSSSSQAVQPPYYLTVQMPGQTAPSFSLTSTYIPVTGVSSRNVLTGLLAVDSNAGSAAGQRASGYGKMRLLELPRGTSVPGPGQMQNNFTADATVKQVLFTLNGSGSSVQMGNLLTLPLANGLLYVQPVYVKGGGTNPFPLLKKVLVGYGDKIGIADSLDVASNLVFTGSTSGTTGTGTGNGTGTTGSGTTGSTTTGGPTTTSGSPAPGSPQAQLQKALDDAAQAIVAADAALKSGNFTAYGQAQAALKDAINRAVAAQRALTTGATSKPSPTASSTPTP